MNRSLTLLSAAVLSLTLGCTEAITPVVGPPTTGGSAKGDFGPPKGEPIIAELTAAP